MAETQTPHDMLATLRWRSIGPPRGGRTVAVTGHPTEPMVFYFGACAGGVWKTADGGTYWENVSDGYFNTAAVGAIAVSESDPNVVYAGTGESCIRGNASHGDGVYRSTDGGDTWTHLGLSDTRHIARVRIHPKDPDLVYVAALGHAYGPNEQRGVFRSADGGATWERVLFKSSGAGAVDLSMDPNNPRVLYASIWQVLRQPWMFTSGGPDSGLFRSTDGGDTWTEITDRPGLPCGLKGRIGLAASPARTGRVWAIVEAEDRGVYRSDDGGETWEKTTDEAALHQRPLVLQPHFRRPNGPRDRLRAQPEGVEVHRRRTHILRDHDAPRRQPRPLDRPSRRQAHDRRQRWRRLRLIQRRRHLVHHLQSADLPVLPHHHRQPVPIPRLRHPAGQQRHQRPQPLLQRGDRLAGRLYRGPL